MSLLPHVTCVYFKAAIPHFLSQPILPVRLRLHPLHTAPPLPPSHVSFTPTVSPHACPIPSHSHPLLVSALVAPFAWSLAAEAQSRMLSAATQLKVQTPAHPLRLSVPLPSWASVALNPLSNIVHKALDT